MEADNVNIVDVLKNDSKLKQVKVIVYTENCIMTGNTYCLKLHRLLDSLNYGSDSILLPIGKDLIPLTEVTVSFPIHKSEVIPYVYIMKASILFVAEKSETQIGSVPVGEQPRIYPWKTKKPIYTEICMPPYNIIGQMHGQDWQQVSNIIDSALKFLPLTHADIRHVFDTSSVTFDFIAINREKITYVVETLQQTTSLFKETAAVLNNKG